MRSVYVFLLAAMPLSAVAQQPASITLSCSGTQKLLTTDEAPTSVINVGFVVDLIGRTVAFASHHIPITSADSTRVDFHGLEETNFSGKSPQHVTITGSIDRVTGAAMVLFLYEQPPVLTKTVFNDAHWEMVCQPANRQF